jgi:hypothetical protein
MTTLEAVLTMSLLSASGGGGAAPGAAPAARVPDPAPAVERDYDEPPGGAPEDQRLWRDLRDETARATVALGRISQCAFRIRYDRHYQSLDAVAQGAAPERAAEAKALRGRLEEDAQAAGEVVPKGRKPGIRACRYTLMFFEQRMVEPAGSKLAGELPATRAEAAGCVADMRALGAAAVPRADALEATLARIDAFLGRAPRPSAAAAARFADELPAQR